MKRFRLAPAIGLGLAVTVATLTTPSSARAQFDEDQTGLWAMHFWSTTFGDGPWGLQGDTQYRLWDVGSDLEQLLLRGGITWTPASAPVTLTGGFAHITSGEFGEGDATVAERRAYQEVLLRQEVGSVIDIRHRYRSEQRWVDDQDFRTRYRYALFVDLALNGRGTGAGALYLALYDEVFINGELDIGEGRTVQRFDRNRLYGALGYGLSNRLKLQGGYMLQTVASASKGQLQISLHTTF